MIEDPPEHGRHDERLGHPVPFDELEPGAGVETWEQHRFASLSERDEEPECAADVEDRCRHHGDHRRRGRVDRPRVVAQPVLDDAVADRDRLRKAGRATREEDQRGVVAVTGLHGSRCRDGGFREEVHSSEHRTVERVAQAIGEPVACDADPCADQRCEGRQLSGGQVGVHLGGGSAEPGCGEDGRDRSGTRQIGDRHAVARTHSCRCKRGRGLSDQHLELTVGDGLVVDGDRNPIRHALECRIRGVADVHRYQTVQGSGADGSSP